MKLNRVLASLILLLLISSGVNAASSPISWTPKSIEKAMGLGTSADISATFSSSIQLRNVDIWIVPELQPFLSVDTSHYDVINANTLYTINLHFSVSNDMKTGLYEGTIHLRKGSNTYPQTLKVSLNVVNIALPVGSQGAVMEITDPANPLYGVKIDVPAGALNNDILLTMTKTTLQNPLPDEVKNAGIGIKFGPDGAVFNSNITITMPYAE